MKVLATNMSKVKKSIQTMLRESKDLEIVLLPLSWYETLLARIEELEDLQEHKETMKSYQRGEGRPFREFLKKHRSEFDIQS